MRWLLLLTAVLFATPVKAGVYYSGDEPNPLPAQWRGFLLDLRALRLAANPNAGGFKSATPLRDSYLAAALKLEAKAKEGALTADEAADLGAIHIRLGQTESALRVLRDASRKHQSHFRLTANLGAAWHQSGDLERAEATLSEAVELAPKEHRRAEQLHLKLVQLRRKEKSADALDDLFGLKFQPGETAKLPDDALAVAQQLCLWLPTDARLLWQLGEVANTLGDVRTAATLLDACVTDFGIKSEDARERRKKYRTAADELDKAADHKAFDGIKFASARAFPKRFDAGRLPKIDPTRANPLPWGALDETEVGKKFAVKHLPYVRDLDGKTVVLSGFMQPAKADEVTEFVLTEFPIGCWFCESPGPFQVVQVEAAGGKPVPFTRGMITVVGKLQLNRTDPERLLFAVVDSVVKGAE